MMAFFGSSSFLLPALSFGLLYAGALMIIIVCVTSARTGKLYAEARRAQELRLTGRAKEAVEVMEAAVRRMPDDPVLRSDFGAALFEAGHVNEAERQFRKAYALDPRIPESAYGIGHCLLGPSPELAVRFFSEAVSLDPAMGSAVEGRGLAHLACGRLAEAAVDLDAACRLRPASARAQMNAGVVATALGDLRTAEAKFREAVRLAPEDALALANLGSLLGSIKEHDEAVLILSRAVAANPAAVKQRIELAYLLRRAGKRDEAIAHLTSAARLDHEDPDVHFRLAMLLEDAGRFMESAASMTRAVALDPRLAGGMTMNQRELIATLPIFEGLDEEDVRRVLASGRTRNVVDGQPLVAEGDPADSVCIVEEGTFVVRKKAVGALGSVLGRLGKGSLVGEMAFFDRQSRSASIVADGAARAIEIPFAAIDAFVAEKPIAGQILLRNFARILSDRLRHLSEESRDRLHWGVSAAE
jgi:tetratricopeptide (TPR) repeat protein